MTMVVPEGVNDGGLRQRPRPRSVTLLGLLLLGQAVGLAGLGLTTLQQAPDTGLQMHDWVIALAFLAIALLAVIAAFGFLRLWPTAWSIAMGMQGLNLAFALVLYFRDRPFYVYELMLAGIFMVIYLHYAEIQAAFQNPTRAPALPVSGGTPR